MIASCLTCGRRIVDVPEEPMHPRPAILADWIVTYHRDTLGHDVEITTHTGPHEDCPPLRAVIP